MEKTFQRYSEDSSKSSDVCAHLIDQDFGGCGAAPARSIELEPHQQSGTKTQTDVQAVKAWAAESKKVSNEFAPFYGELESITLAAENWISPDTEPPNGNALDDAMALLARLEANGLTPTRVIPSAEGGVGIYFQSGGRYADFECLNSGEISGLISDGQGSIEAFIVDSSFEGENRAIKKIRAFLEA